MKTFGLFLLVVQISFMTTSNGTPMGVNLDIEVPEECKGQGFCSVRPRGYDAIEEKLNSILPQHIIDLHTRSSDLSDFYPDDVADNCPSTITTQSVYMYDHDSDEADIIVQTKLIPQQITEVKCDRQQMGNGDQCFMKMALNGVKTSCREQMAERTLLVYDRRIDKIRMKSYNISVCCSCHITTDL
ncbi:uncharacterized protein LOC118268376 [Spodoptera frugiperda]|uniref:Uncharacterized protein LOC118268376 n=1 Tax=Spodoptera frugiperda TaxID=7108 RepID=A0A9R0D3I9_SPOFR|nr:uncharacterized protein LOC118268376 [Spodoptera frugiperda]